MIWFLIVPIAIVLITIKNNKDDMWALWNSSELGGKILIIIGDLTLSFMISFCLILFCGLFVPQNQKQLTLLEQKEIYSVKDNSGFEGHFVLGTRSIESNLQYYYLVKEYLGYKVESCDMEDTNIIEVETKPMYKKYFYEYKNKLLYLIAIDSDFKEVLEVPKDTIKIDYQIDME